MHSAYLILVFAKIIGVMGGVLTAEMIARSLSIHEQGYYYSYLSLVGFYYIFECYTHFLLVRVSHFSSELLIVKNKFSGSVPPLFSGLVTDSFRLIWWQTFAATILIGSMGWFLFHGEKTCDISSWWIACLGSAVTALTTPFLAILEGLGKVKEVSWIRLAQTSGIHGGGLIALHFGFGIHSLGIGFWVMNFATLFCIAPWHRLFIQTFKKGSSYEKTKKVWVNMLKTYLVGCAVISSGSIPILLLRHFQGSEIAGQFGMTRRVFELILVTGASIFTTRTCKFGMLYAADNRSGFMTNIRNSVVSGVLITILGVICVIFGRKIALVFGFRFPERLANDTTIMLLALATVVTCATWGLEIMIRSDGEEPLWKQNIFRCAACIMGYWYCCKIPGCSAAAAMSVAIVLLFILPWNISLARNFLFRWKNKLDVES